MALVHLGVGSNIQKTTHIRSGVGALLEQFGDAASQFRVSRVFRSAAVGFAGRDFFNLVVSFHTKLSAQELNSVCKGIERQFGHNAEAPKFSPRTLDIDILLYDQRISETPVQLPRQEILTNAFVLWPLAELSPNLRHPVTGDRFLALWQNYQSDQQLTPIEFDWQTTFSNH